MIHICSSLTLTRDNVQALDILKDVSKYLYECNSDEVNLSHLEENDRVVAYLEALVSNGLTVSGLVNKLSSFVLALTWHLESSKANDVTPFTHLKEYKRKKTAEKTLKRKRVE